MQKPKPKIEPLKPANNGTHQSISETDRRVRGTDRQARGRWCRREGCGSRIPGGPGDDHHHQGEDPHHRGGEAGNQRTGFEVRPGEPQNETEAGTGFGHPEHQGPGVRRLPDKGNRRGQGEVQGAGHGRGQGQNQGTDRQIHGGPDVSRRSESQTDREGAGGGGEDRGVQGQPGRRKQPVQGLRENHMGRH